jgi:hypothetical protein
MSEPLNAYQRGNRDGLLAFIKEIDERIAADKAEYGKYAAIYQCAQPRSIPAIQARLDRRSASLETLHDLRRKAVARAEALPLDPTGDTLVYLPGRAALLRTTAKVMRRLAGNDNDGGAADLRANAERLEALAAEIEASGTEDTP